MNPEQNSKPKLAVNLGGIALRNPVMVASGTFGYGPEYAGLVDLNKLGAFIVKGISLHPARGNPTPRMAEVPGGLLNAIGLQNPGVEVFLEDHLPFFDQYEVPVIVNIWGRCLEEYRDVAARLDSAKGLHGLELNISCPNIKEGGLAFGSDPKLAEQVIKIVRAATRLPLIPKLSPNVADIRLFARIAQDCGANAISLINSIPAMAIDIEKRQPLLANVTGGLTGPAIHAVALKLVWEAARAVSIPVIGMGGIVSAREALAFIIAGATAVAIGTANFTEPQTTLAVIAGLESYCQRHDIKDIQDLIGSLTSSVSANPEHSAK